MEREIFEKTKLLDENGNVAQPGFARTMLYDYDRGDVKARKSRLKEWDYYLISDERFALCLTMADNGYLGALSASLVDFEKPSEITKSSVKLFTFGKFGMAESSDFSLCANKTFKAHFCFEVFDNYRYLKGTFKNFRGKDDLVFSIHITKIPPESMVIAIPFEKDKHFYLNQKINCMKAAGWFILGKDIFHFGNNALATLDFGRGVWTYDNTWYWASLQTVLPSGDTFGFNLGYGFGDTSAATENMLFHNGKAHKLQKVTFNIPTKDGKEDYMSPWTFSSNDEKLSLTFFPIIDRFAPVDLKVMCMIPHQVFGKFYGKCVLEDGQVVNLDGQIGFAEKVHNKW